MIWRNLVYALLFSIALFSLALAPASAERTAKGAKAKEPSEAQIAAAAKRLDRIPALSRGSLNALRFLIRPKFQDEIISHDSYLHCRAKPISEKYKGRLSILNTIRLLGILRTGMPLDEYANRDLEQMCKSPPDKEPGLLSGLGVQMLTAHASWQLKPRGDVARFAGEVLDAAQKRKIPTRLNSSFIETYATDPIWFGNHFWRAVIMRIAIEMGVPPSRKGIKEWGASLVLLGKTYVKDLGWTKLREQPYDPSGDFHANLMAIAAFRLAAGAPEGMFDKKATAAIAQGLKRARPVMERLEKEYDKLEINSARLFLLQAADGAPLSEEDQLKWDLLGAREAAGGIRVDGYTTVRTSVPADLGFRVPALPLLEETVLTLIMMTGGVLAAKEPPLKGMKRSEINEIWRAMAIVQYGVQQAARRLPDREKLPEQIRKTIAKGVGFLRALQLDDGSFEGIYSDSPANTAIVALALLCSGVSREEPVIRKAMEYLERADWNPDASVLFKGTTRTYSLGILLMLLQKFHEPEQRAAGMLTYKTPKQHLGARRKMWASLSKRRQAQVRRLVERLVAARAVTKAGWGYGNAGAAKMPTSGPQDPRDAEGDRRPSPETEDRSYSDNSNSHFAMLAFKAASLLGMTVEAEIYKKEARRLIDAFKKQMDIKPAVVELTYYGSKKDGKTGVKPERYRVQPGGWGYNATDPAPARRASKEPPKRLEAGGEGEERPGNATMSELATSILDPETVGAPKTWQFSINSNDSLVLAGDSPGGNGPILLRCSGMPPPERVKPRIGPRKWPGPAKQPQLPKGPGNKPKDPKPVPVRRPAPKPRTPRPVARNPITRGPTRIWAVNIGMTSAGVSSLAICLDELILQRALDRKLEKEIKLKMSAALIFIGEVYYPYPNYLVGPQVRRRTSWKGFMDFDAIGNYFDLYAVGRACTNSGAPEELIEKVEWFRIGAALLIKLQKENGEWPRGVEETRIPGSTAKVGVATFNCSFALLFLNRAAPPVIAHEAIPTLKKPRKPVTPEEPKKDSRDDPITPGPKKKQ